MKRPSVKPFGKLSGVALKDQLGLRNGLNNWQFTAVSAVLGLALAAGCRPCRRSLGLGSA